MKTHKPKIAATVTRGAVRCSAWLDVAGRLRKDSELMKTEDTNTEEATTRHPDCAAIGGPTISRMRGCINDEMKECLRCGHCVRWDMTEAWFLGFEANCKEKK